VPIRVTAGQRYVLLGLSPDGRTLATCQDGPDQNGILAGESDMDAVWLWDLARPTHGGIIPTPVVRRSSLLFAIRERIDDPAWSRLFWEIIQAPDPDEEFHNLFGNGITDLTAALLSPDGRLLIDRGFGDPPKTVLPIYDRRGETRQLRIPATEHLLAIGPDSASVTTCERNDQPSRVIVRRRDMASGRELSRTVLMGTMEFPFEQSPDGRWLVGGDETKWHGDQWLFNIETGERHLDISGDARWFFARQGKTFVTMSWWAPQHLKLVELETGRQRADCCPSLGAWLHTISPDGETVAVTTREEPADPLSFWPWFAGLVDRCGLRSEPADRWEFNLLESATGKVRSRLLVGATYYGYRRAAFSDDGRFLAVISDDDIVRIWDLPIRKPWGLILAVAAMPPAAIGLLIITIRRIRRWRSPRHAVTAI
jgi:WD40 repeat protein